MIERYRSDGDLIQISTAPGKDGIVRRIVVKARETGARPDWMVFALTNDTDEQVDRVLVAPHFRLVGSGVIWPDLGGSRIAAITASQGIRPERDENPEADQFVITLDPGTTVTYVAELRRPEHPAGRTSGIRKPTARRPNGLTLYKGIIIGIAGLLALFLTIIFVVKGAIIFPAAASLAWAVLAYACIDFGFLQRIFPITEVAERVYRASTEAVLGATLLVFLFAYLNLSRWHVRYSHVAIIWLLFLACFVGPRGLRSAGGGGRRPHLHRGGGRRRPAADRLSRGHNGYDRAIMLVPDLVPASRLGGGGGLRDHGADRQRPRPAGPDRRPRADRHADRLHGDAACLRGRRPDPCSRLRHRAPRTGPHRRRRRGVRLGRTGRPGLRRPGDRGTARSEARRPRRPGGQLARASSIPSTSSATRRPSTR